MPNRVMTPSVHGLYHFIRLSGDHPVRIHLRVDPDGGGLLLANASQAAHLSPVGVTMARGVLEGLDDSNIIRNVLSLFHGGSVAQVTQDLGAVRKLLADIMTPEDNYPISNFGSPPEAPERRRLMAPFQAYMVPGQLEIGEQILRRLWDVGVPHVTLVGQEDSALPALVRLVECAEDIGMIAGLRMVASWASEKAVREAGLAGLDYLVLVLASTDAEEHDSLLGAGDHAAFVRHVQTCHDMELCPVMEVPLTDQSADNVPDTVQFASEKGISTVIFYAIACLDGEEVKAPRALPARALPQVATVVTECAEECGVRLLWSPPVRMDLAKTLADHLRSGPRAGSEASIRIERDGSVLPPRGARQICGNLLQQSWDEIWQHPAFTRYREVVETPSQCPTCPGLDLCAAACPKDPAGWSDDSEVAP